MWQHDRCTQTVRRNGQPKLSRILPPGELSLAFEKTVKAED
jgi:hypothetical protein